MKKEINIVIAALLVLLAGCRSAKKETTVTSDMQKIEMNSMAITPQLTGGSPASTSPIVYVYKTKADYLHRVPVLMDEARTRILSYPAPGDLKMGNGLRLPTVLDKGYLLDNKGIGSNVAFLTYTYEEYSQLPTAPSMDDLMSHILDKYPLWEIHAFGLRADYKDIVPELNEKIAEGILQK